MDMGNLYVLPRKLTGMVPERWSRRALAPLEKAEQGQLCILCVVFKSHEEKGHTVDICAWCEGGISRECMGDVVIGAIHVMVFLGLLAARNN